MKRLALSSFFFFIAFGSLSLAENPGKRLLFENFALLDNSLHEIVISFHDYIVDENNPPRALLFVPGPVNNATFAFQQFNWVAEDNQQTIIARGDQKNFNEKKYHFSPRITLKEHRLLNGYRIATLQLHLFSTSHNPENPNAKIVVQSGIVRIQFDETDPPAFEALPKDIDIVAKKLFLNYPPARQIERLTHPVSFPSYLSKDRLKIRTHDCGMISLPVQRIQNEWKADLPVESLALYRGKQPIPFFISDRHNTPKQSGILNPDDHLYCYVPESDSPYSSESVLWLALDQAHHRFAPILSPVANVKSTDSIFQTLHLEENHHFINEREKTENQLHYWMWHNFIADGTKTISFNVPSNIQKATAELQIHLGYEPNYLSIHPNALFAELNGKPLETYIQTANGGLACATAALSPDEITAGTQDLSLYFSNTSANTYTKYQAYLDSVQITYPTTPFSSPLPFHLQEDQTTFSVPSDTRPSWLVGHRDSGANDIYAVLEPNRTYQTPYAHEDWRLFFQSSPGTVIDATIEKQNISRFQPQENQQADVILIAPQEWKTPLLPFTAHLNRLDYTSRIVAVEDLYDYYGDGRLDPNAIKAFLHHAYQSWHAPKPSYVILVGDATWDYRGYFNNGVKNYIPAYREEIEYAVENWFVRLDGPNDLLPDMMIARWPVRSQEGLEILIDKTITYKEESIPGDWLNSIFVLTDDHFEMYSDELVADWIPESFRLTRRHINDYSLVDNVYLPEAVRSSHRAKTSLEGTEDVIHIINNGLFLWEYFGHGAPNVLGEERLFFGGGSKYSEVKKLTNRTKLPFLWAFTCETAKFDYPRDKWNISIGEDLLTHPDGGVITLLGATGRGYPRDHLILARGLHESAFHYKLPTQGQLFYAANLLGISFDDYYEPIKQFALLGDPTLSFPSFQRIDGTITLQENGLDYRWTLPGVGSHSTPTFWQADNKNTTENAHLGTTGHLSPAESSSLEKIGVDIIEKAQNAITVYHGALSVPKRETAGPFIEPTTGRLPDLSFVPNSLEFTPPSPQSGETVFMQALVTNSGQASASDVTVYGYKGSPTIGSNQLHAEVGPRGATLKSIHPQQTLPVRLRWDPVNNAGPHTLYLQIDPLNTIRETNRDNNTISRPIHIRKKADLIIHATNTEIRSIDQGQRLELSFEMHNQGESDATKITVQLAVTMRDSDTQHTMFLPKFISLPAGETYRAGGIRLPANIQTLEIIIDPDEIVDEESHANNRYTYHHERSTP
jgi:hypothetical protein